MVVTVLTAGAAGPADGTHRPSARPDASGPRTMPGLGASVHTRLVAAYPAADTVHTHAVTEVRLRFSGPVQPGLSDFTLVGPAGIVRALSDPDTVPGSGATELNASLPSPLGSGDYTLEWRTAGPDSHVIEGSYRFRIAYTPPASSPDSAPVTADDSAGVAGGDDAGDEPRTDPDLTRVASGGQGEATGRSLHPAGVGVRWLFFATLVGMLGVPVFRLAVVPVLEVETAWAPAGAWAVRRATGLAWAVAAVAVVVLPARFWLQLGDVFGGGEVPVRGAVALLGSSWGSAWLLQGAMVALFAIGLLLDRPDDPKRGWVLMLTAALGMSLVPGLSGHASAAGSLRGPVLANDALHVAAAGTWLGGLATLLLVGVAAATRAARDGSAADAEPPPLARVVNAFSRVALVAVAVLVVTGVLNASVHLGGPGDLLATAYGRLLLVKLAVVAAAGALGFYNWRVVRPGLHSAPRPGLLRVPAGLELTLGLVVLLVTAVLVVTPPPGP